MTSTNVNVGLNSENRMTSRVLKPPGGGHTDIFSAAEPEVPRGRRHQVSTIVLGNENSNEVKPSNGDSAVTETADTNKNTEAAPKQQSPEEVDNTPPKEEVKPEPAKMEAPKRVRVPPGGFSSGLW